MIVPCCLGDLFEHALQAFLELAAVGGAGDQRAHVQRDHAPVAQRLGHVAGDDPLGEALDDRRLADAGLADQDGVVLGATREHLDHPADLIVAPDHGVELALLGNLGQIAPEALERALLLLLGRATRAGTGGGVIAHSLPRGPSALRAPGRGNGERASAARTSSVAAAVGDDELGAVGAAKLLELLGELHLRVQRLELEVLDAGMHLIDLPLEVEHTLDAGEVEAELGGHLLDAAQLLDVLLGVEARALGRALRLDQAARLVHAQRLGMHARELGGDGDHEDPAVGLDLDAGNAPSAHEVVPSNRAARGSPSVALASASSAACCSLLGFSGTSIAKR